MKAYSYIRWSSDKQTFGDSLTRQTLSTKAVCEKNGWQLDDTLQPDAGLSAYTGSNLKNGSLAKFLHAVQTKRIATPCVLVIDDLSRFTRLPFKQARREFEDTIDLGVSICTADDGAIYNEVSFDSMLGLFAPFLKLESNHRYSADISRKVKEARKREREGIAKKIICTSNTPAWLKADVKANKFHVIEEKAAIVRRIFKGYANGKGLRTIMREFNKEGVPTFGKGKQNTGNGWSNSHMRRLLCFRGVLGEYQSYRHVSRNKRVPEGQAVSEFYPAIVDKRTFYKVQEILAKQTHKSGCKKNATNLFTGLVKCKCGGSMVIKRSGCHRGNPKWNYVSLICSNAMRGHSCKYHVIRYEWVERAVLTILWTKILPAVSENDTRENELTTLNGELKHVQDTLADYEQKLSKGEPMPKTLQKVLNGLEAQETTLKQQIESLSAKAQVSPLESWQQVPNTIENRWLLQSILMEEIESLTIDAAKLTATLKMKGLEDAIDLAWTRKNKEGFTFLGGKQSPYLDNVFVWKTPQSFVGELEIKLEPPLQEAA
jgi:DNA invertase Pin-like site-specific DNA recombinase